MLNKVESSTIFWVFGMTQPGIELWSPGQLANTLPFRPLGKIMNPFILLAIGQIVPLLFFYRDDFHIKSLLNINIPLNREAKNNNKKAII